MILCHHPRPRCQGHVPVVELLLEHKAAPNINSSVCVDRCRRECVVRPWGYCSSAYTILGQTHMPNVVKPHLYLQKESGYCNHFQSVRLCKSNKVNDHGGGINTWWSIRVTAKSCYVAIRIGHRWAPFYEASIGEWYQGPARLVIFWDPRVQMTKPFGDPLITRSPKKLLGVVIMELYLIIL